MWAGHLSGFFFFSYFTEVTYLLTMTSILLVEDDLSFVQITGNFLKKKGYTAHFAHNLKEARASIQDQAFDLILLDYHLPDGDAFGLIETLQEKQIKTPVIIMTGFSDVKTVVRAMKLGASDYITKPVNPEELLLSIQQALHKKNEPKENAVPEAIKGSSTISRELNRMIELVAPTNFSVIILGESGTGKEYVARMIHGMGERKKNAFVAIDCGALSDELASSELFGHTKGAFTGAVADKKGAFELANGGTLFLDEVGNLTYAVQVKLLRAIQEREVLPVGGLKPVKVNVRLITATNENLRENIKSGNFREDLFHRLNEFSLQVPPLREREEDLLLFIGYFISQSNRELSKHVKGVSVEVLNIFKNYSWPGNLRELRNIIRRAVLLATENEITINEIPPGMVLAEETPATKTTNLKQMNEANEKELILKTLLEVRYNKTKAAAILNIDRKTLYLKMAKYGIEA